jgi:hypothetical protein
VIYGLRTIDITRSSIIVPHLLRFGCSQPSLSWVRIPSLDVFFIPCPIPVSSFSRISKWIGGYTGRCTLVAIREPGREGLVDKVESRVFFFCKPVRIEFAVVACIITIVRFVVTGSPFPLMLSVLWSWICSGWLTHWNHTIYMIMKKTRIPPTIPGSQHMTWRGFIAVTDDSKGAHAVLGNLFVVTGFSKFRSRYSRCTSISDRSRDVGCIRIRIRGGWGIGSWGRLIFRLGYMLSWFWVYVNVDLQSEEWAASLVALDDLSFDAPVDLFAAVWWEEVVTPVDRAELDIWLLDICELTTDVSAGKSDSSAGDEDCMELGAGIEVAESINEDTGVSEIAGAKTFVSPRAEADEPAWAEAAGALSTGGELEDIALWHQFWSIWQTEYNLRWDSRELLSGRWNCDDHWIGGYRRRGCFDSRSG